MKKGISFQGYVPIRQEPSESSEMISQVLFGEEFCILDTKGDWLLISLDFDSFEGWLKLESINTAKSEIREENSEVNTFEQNLQIISFPIITIQDLKLGQQCILPAGSVWPSAREQKISLYGSDFEVRTNEGLVIPGPEVNLEKIGKGLLSLPHIPGGRSGFGFDGPGLVQMLCRMKGIKVPRYSNQQAELGSSINFMHEVKCGDLAFFDNANGEIDHAGILMEGGRILHVHNQVRIDRFDQQGIYCSEKDKYTHKLRIIKRMMS